MPVIFFLDDRIWGQEKKYSVKKKNKAVAAIFFLDDRAKGQEKKYIVKKKNSVGRAPGGAPAHRRSIDRASATPWAGPKAPLRAPFERRERRLSAARAEIYLGCAARAEIHTGY